MDRLSFSRITALINNTCRAMDIRCIAFKENSEWRCVVTVIRLTYRSVEKVKLDQKALKERLGEIGSENVEVLYDSLPISDLESLIANVKENRFVVAGLNLSLKVTKNDLLSENLANYVYLNQNEPETMYPHHEIILPSETSPLSLLGSAGVTGPSLGIDNLNDLQSWLGVSILGSNIAMAIVVPIYIQLRQPILQNNGIIQAEFSAHEWFLKRSKIFGLVRSGYNQGPIQRKELDFVETAISDNIVVGVIKGAFSIEPTQRDARLEFYFLDPDFGVLSKCESLTLRMLSQCLTPLHTSFSLFDGGKNFEEYLLHPRGRQADIQFSSSVSWLLELSGLKVLNLSLLSDAEHLRIEGKEEGSCDILATLGAGENSPVLLIDCTTAVPSQDKLARIRLTGEEITKHASSLFQKLQVPLRPVVVVSKNVPELLNPEYQQAGTYVWDVSHLNTLLQLVQAGKLDQALRSICDWLYLPYLVSPSEPRLDQINIPGQ